MSKPIVLPLSINSLVTGVSIEQGRCVIESISVARASEDIVAVDINCATKYPEVSAYTGRGLLIDSERGEGDDLTIVEFSGEGDVHLIAAGNRYTLSVAIVRDYSAYLLTCEVNENA